MLVVLVAFYYNIRLMRTRWYILITIWLALLATCMVWIDQPVKQFFFDHQFHLPSSGLMKDTIWTESIQALGCYPTIIGIVFVLIVLTKLSWRDGLVILIVSAVGGLNEGFKWIFGRSRPVANDGSLTGPWDFIPFGMRDTGMAFPSGHTMLAFATATCLARYYPRWVWLCYFLAALVAVERVLEVAHHVSDVIAAAGLGIILSTVVMNLLNRQKQRTETPALEMVNT